MITGTIVGDKKAEYRVIIEYVAQATQALNASALIVHVYIVHPKMDISARTGSVTINGTPYTFNTPAYDGDASGDAGRLVGTIAAQVDHDTDGSKSVDISASFPFNLTSSEYGKIRTLKAAGTVELEKIDRASVVASQSESVVANGKNKWTLSLTKYNAAYRHKAALSIGSKRYETEVFDTSTSYVIPIDWLEAMPNSASGVVSVRVQTYMDESCSAKIGEEVETSFEITAPQSASPNIQKGYAEIVPYNTNTAAAGMTVFVDGISKAQVNVDKSKITAQYGASIASIRMQWGTYVDTVEPFRTGVLKNKDVVRIIAEDSRGLVSYIDSTVTTLQYSPPVLSGVVVYRCNSAGEEDDQGTFLFFKAKAVIASCGGENTVTLTAAYKPVQNSTWSNFTEIADGIGSVLGAGGINPTLSYNVRIQAKDRLGRIATYDAVVSTAEVAFNIRKGGKGASFGKYAEADNLLDCEWMFRARGGIHGVSVYTEGESEHGVWTDNASVYVRTFRAEVASAAEYVSLGAIDGLGIVVDMHGVLLSNGGVRHALNDIIVAGDGTVSVKAPAAGYAHVIVHYTKEE